LRNWVLAVGPVAAIGGPIRINLALRSIGSTVGREMIRGLLRSIFGGSRRRR
jgi:hypothetical protein